MCDRLDSLVFISPSVSSHHPSTVFPNWTLTIHRRFVHIINFTYRLSSKSQCAFHATLLHVASFVPGTLFVWLQVLFMVLLFHLSQEVLLFLSTFPSAFTLFPYNPLFDPISRTLAIIEPIGRKSVLSHRVFLKFIFLFVSSTVV